VELVELVEYWPESAVLQRALVQKFEVDIDDAVEVNVRAIIWTRSDGLFSRSFIRVLREVC
jgi:hypothetical protein